jgi:hypothetical protein
MGHAAAAQRSSAVAVLPRNLRAPLLLLLLLLLLHHK